MTPPFAVNLARRQLLLAAAWAGLLVPGTPLAQRVYRVAFVTITGTRETPFVAAMLRRFTELGYREGRNFQFDFRGLVGQWEKLPVITAELARAQPDLAIAAGSESVLKAFRQAMGSTPIVMVAVDFDPVEKNYIATLSRPGGNITGLFFRQAESAAKRVELLREALPQATRIAVLFDFSTRDQYQAALERAQKLGLSLLPFELRENPYDFEAALGGAAAAKAHAVLALTSGAFYGPRAEWIAVARKHALPVIANPNYADAGALIAFGANFSDMYARAAEYADRILKGAKPAEMPVEQPSKFDLVVNLRTAKELGVTLPPSFLLRASRVID